MRRMRRVNVTDKAGSELAIDMATLREARLSTQADFYHRAIVPAPAPSLSGAFLTAS